MSQPAATAPQLAGRAAAAVFLAFASAYFLSALLRSVTATLAPVFSAELGLGAADMGLLAGTYFLGFSAMQLPLGIWLDRIGPKRVLCGLLTLAIAGCLAFAAASSVAQLMMARFVIGMGVSACLMAPLTLFRRALSVPDQLRANSWLLMTGSLGMLASTMPAQWLLPMVGWRGLFAAVAATLMLATLLIAWVAPADLSTAPSDPSRAAGYAEVFRAPAFRRFALPGFFSYGGLIAMQSLWIGPWLTQVGQRTPADAARGLFVVNASMLVAFLAWGLAMPRLVKAGWSAGRVIGVAWPMGVICLAWIIWLGQAAGPGHWALWCVLTSVVSLSQPAVAQAFPAAQAGRALSAFNLVIFFGVFSVQWGLGLLIDALAWHGWSMIEAYRAAFASFAIACAVSFLVMQFQARRWVRQGRVRQR